MSSFLQSLALRESGAAAVLAPRVSGWFESPAPIAPGLLSFAEPERDAPAIAAPLPVAQPPAAARMADEADPAPAPRAPTLAAAAAPPLLNVRSAAAPAPHDPPPRDVRHPASAPLAALTRTIAAAAPLASPVPPLVALPPAASDAPAPPMRAMPPEPPANPAPRPAHTEPALRPALSAMPARGPRLAQAVVQVAQAGAGRRASPDAPPQPVVQVTIGRLEVRAERAPTAPPAPRPRQSPTSLDDYLAQRNGAGRR